MHKKIICIFVVVLISLSVFNKYYDSYLIDNKDNNNTNNNRIESIEKNLININSKLSIVKKHTKIIYLTFDDGPTNNMYKILKILDKYDAKVTFFFVASRLSSYRQQCKLAISKKHTIGSHSFSHIPNKLYSSLGSFKDDLSLCQTIFNKEFGFIPKLFRFPYGSNSRFIYVKNEKDCLSRLAIEVLKNMNIIYVDWSVTSGDGTDEASADEIYYNVIQGIEDKDIPVILLHEWNEKTISVLDKILKYGKEKGYEFCALNEDLNMPHFVE